MTQRNAVRRRKKLRRRQITGQLRRLHHDTTDKAVRARAAAEHALPVAD